MEYLLALWINIYFCQSLADSDSRKQDPLLMDVQISGFSFSKVLCMHNINLYLIYHLKSYLSAIIYRS